MSTLKESDTSSRLGYATVLSVNGNIVRVKSTSGTMIKNEVAYVCVGEERLKSEVLRIYGDIADLQVFEETHGIRYGDRVELSGQLLSVTLGPGMLGVIYDGLQNPLTLLAEQDGFFLKRGRDVEPLDNEREWQFTPICKPGDRVVAGQPLGHLLHGLRVRHLHTGLIDPIGDRSDTSNFRHQNSVTILPQFEKIC